MKKIYFLSLISLFFLLLTGCASIVRSGSAGDKIYSDIKSAKMGSEPIGKVAYETARNIKISNNSPYLNSPTAKGRYEIVSVSGEKGKAFRMVIAGICDCLGFRKWTVIPIAYMLDDQGEIIASGFFVSANFQLLVGVFPESKDYHVMVVADTANEGKTLGSVPIPLSLSWKKVFNIPTLIAHPTGVVQINFETNMETPLAEKEMEMATKSFTTPPANKAAIYIFRNNPDTPPIKKSIYIDGKPVGEIIHNSYIYKEISPGNHTLTTDSHFGRNSITFQAEGGKIYFARHYTNITETQIFIDQADIKMVGEKEGRGEVLQSRMVAPLPSTASAK